MIQNEMKSDNVAALAIGVIDAGKLVHLSTNGFSDIEKHYEASIHTPFHIASISKTVTNLAVFKLVESKRIDLNTDINTYLPFKVKNPHYPNETITVRELLNHRSGIRDNYDLYETYWENPKGDSPFDLKLFLKEYLNEDGKLYETKHFESNSNHKSFAYSNTGYALLGLLIEIVSEMKYEEFCQTYIFKPLEMHNTSWFLRNLDSTLVAKTYVKDHSGLKFKGHNGYPDYPGGQLRTSISDFSKLWVKYLNSNNKKFILEHKTTSKITPNPQISHQGYYTWFPTAINNHLYYNHNGADLGARTEIFIDVAQKRGIIVFANSEYDITNLCKNIEKNMWAK
ncbi:serine hydrolase domain-containing protein [Tenacibaculum sp. MAR_2009_124]|uniref:serine hydrolase domain-containing protein n=1 Tax=Tenacibaculum sp. MAR_2009_124 TaxID=1250059 RepID=UPI0015A23CB3|nr:serine hydrolase domain-containing protein [Tenacibaculum sp. MAR_2009_124]